MGSVLLWGWCDDPRGWVKILVTSEGKLIIDPEVTEALEADVGDASASTLGSLYGILGNPAQSLSTRIGYQGATSLANKLTAARAVLLDNLDHSIADLITRLKGLDEIHDDIEALPTAKSFDTVRYTQDLVADATYYPPDNHILTGIIVENTQIEIQAKDYFGTWRNWKPYDTYVANALFTLNLACDGVNVRVINDGIGTYSFTAYLMRQA